MINMSKAALKNTQPSDEIAYKLKVLVLESDKTARGLIKEALTSLSPGVVIDEAASVAKAVSALEKKDYTFFFVGLALPDRSELSAIRFARSRPNSPHTCVVSGASDETSIFQAISGGASGYIWKLDSPREIRRHLAITLEGGSAISPVIAGGLISYLQHRNKIEPPTMSRLTAKESQIINLSARGHNFKEISNLMEVKMSTVYTHVRHIYEKLHVTSVSQALNIARKQGLLRT
jgi:DNA-binding NarL/FixJ family response regulator